MRAGCNARVPPTGSKAAQARMTSIEVVWFKYNVTPAAKEAVAASAVASGAFGSKKRTVPGRKAAEHALTLGISVSPSS